MNLSKITFRRWAQRFVPDWHGRFYLSALHQPVTIRRDQWGIPHIEAANRHDLFVAQGFVHAQDRLWQMELNRRVATGTLSAVFGRATLDTDRLSRALGFARLAQGTWAHMPGSSRADVEAYTEGVNAYLQSGQPLPVEFHLLRHQPEPWQPLDSIAFARLQMWALTEGASGELVTAQLIQALGEDRARQLLPHYPAASPVALPEGIEVNGLRQTAVLPAFLGKYTANGAGRGSNGWVIAASRSSTDHAILCNDMHLPLTTPSLWHFQHLCSQDGFHVTGFTQPGLPYVLIGHNSHIAWGATLSFVDCEDFFLEKLHPDDPTRYEFAGEWRQAEVFTERIAVRGQAEHVEKVICTHHGPIIPHFQIGKEAQQAVALASTALRPDLAVDGFGLLNQAKSWEEFETAVFHIQAPSLNLLYADIHDNIGHWVTGKVPVRAQGDGLAPAPGWTGTHEWLGEIPFTDMPHALNPQQGYIVSANHRLVDDEYPHYLGQVWRNGYRAQRIEQLINSQEKLAPADCQRMQQDVYSIPGHRLAQQLKQLQPMTEAAQISWYWLTHWDGWLGADSIGGTIYEVFGVAGAGPAAAAPGDPVDPTQELSTYAKTQERAEVYLTPGGLTALATLGAETFVQALIEQGSDPERFYLSDACWSGSLTCAGDVRLTRWRQDDHGKVREVLFTARNGATSNGHVWATDAGPRKRPMIVITPGSVQAPEQLYWWAAQVLAKKGYVVLTRDAQGQGQSDTFGEGVDFLDSVPSQTAGVTFYDGTQDALDFALSRKGDRYCPRPSRSGTSHCPKQKRRVAEGLNAGWNPFARLVDRTRVGLAGHSYGAAGVSWVGQQDRRVDAVVAWDNLCDVTASTPPRLTAGGNVPAGCLEGGLGSPQPRVPSLGISNDYGLTPTPFATEPDPKAKSQGSRAFSKAGVDTGQLVIRGGTHYEYSFIPTPTFGATRRGIDLAAWYTTAWFDRYVKDRPTGALGRLLSDGWRHDAVDRRVDPEGRGNLLSRHHLSRLDLGRDGGPRVRCENLRSRCDALRADDRPSSYSYVRIATSRDR